MTRDEASDLVADLVLAVREHERRSGDKYYRQQYEEIRDRVIATLTTQERTVADSTPKESSMETEQMSDILEDLANLYKQATTERSHYYVASCCKRAAEEISKLRNDRDGWKRACEVLTAKLGKLWNE